jgi:hypothetical protein
MKLSVQQEQDRKYHDKLAGYFALDIKFIRDELLVFTRLEFW